MRSRLELKHRYQRHGRTILGSFDSYNVQAFNGSRNYGRDASASQTESLRDSVRFAQHGNLR